jgi:hypothetical protein
MLRIINRSMTRIIFTCMPSSHFTENRRFQLLSYFLLPVLLISRYRASRPSGSRSRKAESSKAVNATCHILRLGWILSCVWYSFGFSWSWYYYYSTHGRAHVAVDMMLHTQDAGYLITLFGEYNTQSMPDFWILSVHISKVPYHKLYNWISLKFHILDFF